MTVVYNIRLTISVACHNVFFGFYLMVTHNEIDYTEKQLKISGLYHVIDIGLIPPTPFYNPCAQLKSWRVPLCGRGYPNCPGR